MLAPGPRGLAALLLPFRFQRDPLGTLEVLERTHGPLVRLRLGPQRAFVVSHPDHIRHMYVEAADRYVKPARMKKVLGPILGEGLFTSDGNHWRRSRRLAQPFFHRQALADTMPLLNEAAQAMVRRLGERDGQEANLAVECTRFSMHVAARMFLGIEDNAELDALGPIIATASESVAGQLRGFFPVPRFIPTAGNRAYSRVLTRMHELCARLIADRRKSGGPADDFIGKLISATDGESGRGYSDEEIRDELCTFFIAGHDTTANALSWTLHELATRPDIEERLRAEEEQVLGGRTPTAADLPKLEYTLRVVEETNRLYPQAWVMAREAALDDEVGGYAVPRGSFIFIATWLTHRNPEYWPDPIRFDPDRFLPERVKERPRYSYIPFGAGQRLCIGNNLSLLESVVAVAAVVRALKLRVRDGFVARPRPRFALDIVGGLPARIERRVRAVAA